MHDRRTSFTPSALAIVVVAFAGGCVSGDAPVPRAPTLTFVARDDARGIAVESTDNADVAPSKSAMASRAADAANEAMPRLTIAANDLRIRFDGLKATVGLSGDKLGLDFRQRLDDLRSRMAQIDDQLTRLKVASVESSDAIASELDRSLVETDQLLRDAASELAARRAPDLR